MALANNVADRCHTAMFGWLYGRSLVFNTCWEDPAVDRRALDFGPDDEVLVITSAGCNALDYALAGVKRVHAVDANPIQNALLELKIAGIRTLAHDDFFQIFGEGRHPEFRRLFRDRLAPTLSPFAARYWSRRLHWFSGRGVRKRFYWYGLSGTFAHMFRGYTKARPTLRRAIYDMLDARDMETQRAIYRDRVAPSLWTPRIRWALRRRLTMALLGVPTEQRAQIAEDSAGDVPGFVREVVDRVFDRTPIHENYHWSLYVRGHYTRSCCPTYLRSEGFHALKDGLVDRVACHTDTVEGFLTTHPGSISRFVLLDHMDWMGKYDPAGLAAEWQTIIERAAPMARIIFRSAAKNPTFLEELMVETDTGPRRLTDLLVFDRRRAAELDRADRVGTYASFHIADLLNCAPEAIEEPIPAAAAVGAVEPILGGDV